ncbi:MAG: tandem-95 repeat protein, partial [Pelagibacterales bacterium]|nr:tandem-95 repeat protein [Pelagibacterales bacterium]
TIKIADLLANDSDVEDGINIQNTTFDKFVFSNPTKGKIVKDAVNGTITYTPNSNYNGADSLTYQIKDSNGALSNKATINLTVNAVNDGPVTVNDAFTLNEDTSLTITFASILANDSDVEDGVNIKKLTKDNIVFNNPSNGTITVTDTGIIYKPNKDFNGTDVITYQIKDSAGALSNVANINLTIKAINDIAVAGNDSFVTDEDQPITIKIADLLANDSDVEDGINIQNTTFDKFVFSNPTKGKIVKDAVNGTITYTPNKDFDGIDSLTYQIKDSAGALSNKATISLTVNSVNDAPIVAAKLANQTAKAGNTFTYTLPTNAFSDVDKDLLNYSAKMADDSDLPSWLKFNDSTKTFSGISPSGASSTLAIKVIASDGSLSASQNFNLAISSNVINGTTKNDSLNGTTSNDEIYGNDGVDTIKGNAGNDLIIGGKGADFIYGGVGDDQFIFKNLNESTNSESDLIMDFVKGEDKIDLSELNFDSITKEKGSNTSSYGLEYYFDGKNTVIDDPNSDFLIKISGNVVLDEGDFIF